MTSFQHILLIGVGLIGGSLALALRKSGYAGHIAGIDRSEEALRRAHELGLIDEAAVSLAEAARRADLILVAAPVAQMGGILTSVRPVIREGALVTDVGSTKSDVVQAAYEALGSQIGCFIPAHPIAGREKNGPDAAVDDLFSGKKLVITPLPENTGRDIDKVAAMWRQCGAIIHLLSPEDHDNIFALISHLPHLLSYALVDQAARHVRADLMFEYAASGFRDFTRIAGSSPEMWRDISLANQKQLLLELDGYLAELGKLRDMLARGDGQGLEAVYTSAQRARMNWIHTIEAAEKQKEGA
ncbi:MAG: prephenate dehydrogenase/arogenate dehydrogenase family protein [Oxalobacter formigenes]|nr:prephenate dehydrogenase/arogenate dehydrogenase family protein [Oxalobacter formigenes]